MKENYDFSGWVIKYDHSNSYGRTYRKDCLKDNNDMIVPLCWNHDHRSAESLLGNVLLGHSDDGVFAYGKLNTNRVGGLAEDLIKNRSVFLSPYINKLKMDGNVVLSGVIREVSLVMVRIDPDECYRPVWKEK